VTTFDVLSLQKDAEVHVWHWRLSPAAASLTTLNSPHFLMLAQVLLS
jgi:hypothetical protein